MNKKFLILPLVFLLCLTFGCQEGEEVAEAVSDVMSDIAAVRGMTDRYDETHNAGDADKLVSLVYMEDSVRMPPYEGMLVGKAAILEWYRASFDQNEYDLDNIPVEGKVSGDLAYLRGIYTIAIVPKAGGDTETGGGHWVAVYERQPEGGWKTVCDIWVVDTSVTADDAGPFQGGVMSGAETADAEADVAAIRSSIDGWDAALEARDYDKMAAFFDEDAISISHGTPAIVSGSEKILAPYREELEKYDIDIDKKALLDVRASGDLGMARGVEAGTATPKDGGEPISYDIKWLAIFVRQDDGSWQCVLDIGNPNK